MQLWPFISHSGFLLESRFSDFFKFAIFSTKISLFLQIHFNLLEDKHSFGYFWTPKSTYDICSVFLYMLSYTLSPKNSKIEILFCQTLRPECIDSAHNRHFCHLIDWRYFTALKNQTNDLQLLMRKELNDCHHETFKGIVILSAQARNCTI